MVSYFCSKINQTFYNFKQKTNWFSTIRSLGNNNCFYRCNLQKICWSLYFRVSFILVLLSFTDGYDSSMILWQFFLYVEQGLRTNPEHLRSHSVCWCFLLCFQFLCCVLNDIGSLWSYTVLGFTLSFFRPFY